MLAACVAEALRPARDGRQRRRRPRCGLRRTGRGRRSRRSSAAAAQLDGWRSGGLAELRAAFAPFDSVGEHLRRARAERAHPEPAARDRGAAVALGLLVATGGDYAETVLGGVNYGRDSDSIASMGGALAGALGGIGGVPRDWVDEVSAASRIDIEEAGREMAAVAVEIFAKDARRHERRARAMADADRGRSACVRVTWVQPEDLVGHELRQAREEGKDVDAIEARWLAAGGRRRRRAAPRRSRRRPSFGALALELLDELDATAAAARRPRAGRLRRDPRRWPTRSPGRATTVDLATAIAGAWLGRAAGCVLGKPVEGLPREGIRELAEATGNWPVAGWFTAAGPPAGGARSAGRGTARAGRRASPRTSTACPRTTTSTSRCSASLCSSATGTASTRSTSRSSGSTTSRRAGSSPPSASPCGTCSRRTSRRRPRRAATRSASGSAPAARRRLRLGGAAATLSRAARMAWADARVSHTANGVYAAMFMAAAHAASLTGVVRGRVRRRRPLGRSAGAAGSPRRSATRASWRAGGDWEAVVDELYESVRRPTTGCTRSTTRRSSRPRSTPSTATSRARSARSSRAGWDTDTNGAAVGSILGATRRRRPGSSDRWTAPLDGRFASSLPGFDGIDVDELVRRTLARRRRCAADA